jgi:hypothetical protein
MPHELVKDWKLCADRQLDSLSCDVKLGHKASDFENHV